MIHFFQKEITLAPYNRGFHLITENVLREIPEIKNIRVGELTVFIKHTSASLTINENADRTVRTDFENFFNEIVSENKPYFEHTLEGSDDMPAHLKTSLLGNSIKIPVTNGKCNLGTWQGIYLCEHRNYGGARSLVINLIGDTFK